MSNIITTFCFSRSAPKACESTPYKVQTKAGVGTEVKFVATVLHTTLHTTHSTDRLNRLPLILPVSFETIVLHMTISHLLQYRSLQ